jgi:non-heme chloroperoxidase
MRMSLRLHLIVLGLLLLPAGSAFAQAAAQDRYFITSDGVRLHYLEAGPRTGHTIVFVPGWTMPAWIWQPQLQAFARRYHVVAFDPRGQGESDAPAHGYEPNRRGQDIAELVAHLEPVPVVLVGWSPCVCR